MRNVMNQLKGKGNGWLFLYSFLFSTMVILSRHIFYRYDEESTLDTTFVTDFHVLDLIAVCFITVIVYCLVKAITFGIKAISASFIEKERKRNILIFAGIFTLIFIPWIPYFFSYWPGGIYADTIDSIHMALGKMPLDNHNPVMYTMIWKFVFWITGGLSGEGEYAGLNLFTVLQALVLAIALSYFVYYCYRKGVHKYFVCFLTFLFAVYPLYPFYGVSMWKDTLFSIAVFAFSIFLYDVFARKTENISKLQLFLYGMGSMLIIFLRNNGIYIALFYSIVIVCMNWKKHRMIAQKIGIISLIIIVISGVIQGPVFEGCGYNIDRDVESFGIPIQQTAYILSTDGKVNDEELEILDEIMPLENWKALYNPVVVDSIKFDTSFNKDYFENNTGEFVKVYWGLIRKNPVKAMKAYLLETMGFWDIFENSPTAYICNFHFGNVEYFMSDYFEYLFGISFRNLVEPKNYISVAVFVWVMLATICICLAKKYYEGLIPILPTLGVWLTIMVATPVAFSLRYVYAIFLCIPLYAIICVKAVSERE
ncbi:MAG: DUF6020 family protein [Lachnospiraceae bacterium]